MAGYNGISNRQMRRLLGPAGHPRVPSAIGGDVPPPAPTTAHPIRAAKVSERAAILTAKALGGDVAAARQSARAGVATAVQEKAGMIRASRQANRMAFAVEHPVIAARQATAGGVQGARLTGRAGVLTARGTGGDVAAARQARQMGVAQAITGRAETIATAQQDPNSQRSERGAAQSSRLLAKAQRLTNRAARY